SNPTRRAAIRRERASMREHLRTHTQIAADAKPVSDHTGRRRRTAPARTYPFLVLERPPSAASITIREAITPADIDAARALFREYVAALPISSEHLWYQNVAHEFATLPGKYAPPRGRILLAWETSD